MKKVYVLAFGSLTSARSLALLLPLFVMSSANAAHFSLKKKLMNNQKTHRKL